jgi:TolB-like protein
VIKPSHTVFLSYASEDAGAVQKVYQVLRAAGIEVFLDESELRGGDAWDQKIQHEIRECTLFIPIVSQHTQERLEGYFRHEWNLAVARTHHMAQQKPFLVPVVIDDIRDQEAFVPDAFRAVQWTRLPGGETPPAFVERIQRLLTPVMSPVSAVSGAAAAIREPGRPSRRLQRVVIAIGTIGVVLVMAYFVANEFRIPRHETPEAAARAGATPTTFNPPRNSIAVLPFVNLSGDKEQDYFSDGLTEDLLDSLARIKELQVAARTSSFYFRGKDVELGTVARRLNVASVLEGSVRRSGHRLRITAQLSNAVNGFDLWSQTYDRDLGDVLNLQREIAEAVAAALKLALFENFATTIEVGGTRNPEAFDTYLRAPLVPM